MSDLYLDSRTTALVAIDACSGQDGEEHRFAFEKIFPRLARVRTTEEVLKALA